MSHDRIHIRYWILYEFNHGKNANQAIHSIFSVYGEHVVDASTCYRWFERFESGHFDLQDKEGSGYPLKVKDAALEALLEEDPWQSSRQLAEQLSFSHPTILNRLHALEKIQKSGKWVPHELSELNIQQRLNICIYLWQKQKKKLFYGK